MMELQKKTNTVNSFIIGKAIFIYSKKIPDRFSETEAK